MSMNNIASKIINHTADIGFIIYGDDMKQLFTNAAFSLVGLIVEPEIVSANMERCVSVHAENHESLLVEWLNELIYLFDAEHVLFSKFTITNLSSKQLTAVCYGEKVNRFKYSIKREVKAATYHMLKIDKLEPGYRAQVIFDL